jgi:putative ABC transport system substrate-binding protein
MKRRDFLTLLGGAAAAWPLAVRAQQRAAVPVIGFLCDGSSERYMGALRASSSLGAFDKGLAEAGYVEGRNLAIEYRFADNDYGRLPAMAADLVSRHVAVIAAIGAFPTVRAAKSASTITPIAFSMGADPVRLGIVDSLSRPGGNLTGVTNLNAEVGQKRLELLHDVVPTATSFCLLVNPSNPTAETQTRDLEAAARKLGLGLHILRASTERDFDSVFATVAQTQSSGLVISGDGMFVSHSEQLAALALRYSIPAIFEFRWFVAGGGLMSYGGNRDEAWRQVGTYVGRILNGAKPGDLPVQQATTVELLINLKTAKALGLTVPLALLARADEVIE